MAGDVALWYSAHLAYKGREERKREREREEDGDLVGRTDWTVGPLVPCPGGSQNSSSQDDFLK
jgi:hypothetical protein